METKQTRIAAAKAQILAAVEEACTRLAPAIRDSALETLAAKYDKSCEEIRELILGGHESLAAQFELLVELGRRQVSMEMLETLKRSKS